MLLAFSGVVGLWAVGFFTPDLMRYVQHLEPAFSNVDRLLAAEELPVGVLD